MGTITRTDSIPVNCNEMIEKLTKRALRCGLTIVKTFDGKLPNGEKGVIYRTLVLEGPRSAVIRYFGRDIIEGCYEKGCLKGLLELMFG